MTEAGMTDLTATRWVANALGAPGVLETEQVTLHEPAAGEVLIDVKAVGINPTDYKGLTGAYGPARSKLPLRPGQELAGVIAAIGPHTEIASGGGAVGDEVIVFRLSAAYATRVIAPAHDVFAKPANLPFPEAANLLLVGCTAADAMRVTGVKAGDTVLVHGASGAVGVSLLQQLRMLGATVIGTASPKNFGTVEGFGATPVAYGDGLEQRVRELAPRGIDVAIDTVGTDEAVDVSLALVSDRTKFVTIAALGRADAEGFQHVGGMKPESMAFRDTVRQKLIDLAASGHLAVPMGRTFPFADAVEALQLLASGHPGGKLALIP